MTDRPDARFRISPLWSFPAVAIAALVWVSAAPAQSPRARASVNGRPAVAGDVLVKFKDSASPGSRRFVVDQLDTDGEQEIGGAGVRHLHSRSRSVEELLETLAAHPDVEYAEPNYIFQSAALPNDPQFGQLWGLFNQAWAGGDIDATQAWDVATGSSSYVVGVIDTGTDYNHEDLAANIWTAPSSFTVTIGGQSISCAAGTHGFNAITNSCNPADDNNHGTHTAGTVGAVGNNGVGVSGVSHATRIMPLKFLDASNSGTLANAINAIEFAIQAKARLGASANVRVLSNSWGGGGFSQALLDEINKANSSNMLFVAAAGNYATDTDASPFYPASFTAPNIISVAATDSGDFKAGFSNYGATSVDLGAPGVDILSTTVGNTYQYKSGTSMATPHVAGAAALVLSRCNLDTAALKSVLLSTVDPLGSLTNVTVTGGRLNVNNAVRGCTSAPTPLPAAPTGLSASGSNAQVSLSWNTVTGAASYTVKRGTSASSLTVIASGLASTSFTDVNVVNGTTYYYAVNAVNSGGTSANSNTATATPSAPIAPSSPTNLSASATPKKISLSWSGSPGAASYVVLRSQSSGSGFSTIASVIAGTRFQDSAVSKGIRYYYLVAAVNAVGTSDYSNQVAITAR